MSDLRWSYDSRTKELDVWDSENNRIQHYDRCGEDGYKFCSQGRIYPNLIENTADCYIYGNRPVVFVNEDTNNDGLREEAKVAVEKYLDQYGVGSRTWITVF